MGYIDKCINDTNVKEYYCNDQGICESYESWCGVSTLCLEGYCRSPGI
jgi:hypothetical protein